MADIEALVREAVAKINASQTSTQRGEKKKIDFISLENAKYLACKVEAKAREMGVNAVVAVGDDSGTLILLECMDNSYIASRDIAINKVYTSASLKMSTAKLATLAQPGAPLYGVQFTNGGRIVIFGGGETLEVRGRIIGAVGVSGGSAEEDTALASYAKEIFEKAFM